MDGRNGQELDFQSLSKMIRNKYFLIAFRLIVGSVFLWAGLLKIFDPLGFAQDITNYRTFPQVMSFFMAIVLPWVEVVSGILLILGIFSRASSLILSSLLVAFLVLTALTILRGLDVDCGCFGSLSHKADFKLIIQDGILLFLSLNIFFSRRST